MLKKKTSQAGDTIVEVLICILVISTVLAGAFVVTNQSLQSVRDSQERSQAIKLAETQFERLRTTDPTTISSLGYFCLSGSSAPTTTNLVNSNSCYTDQNGNENVTVSGGTLESIGSINGLYSGGNGPWYHVVLNKTVGPGGDVYRAQIKWVTTKGTLGQINMYYSVEPQL